MDVNLIKTASGMLAPADEDANEQLRKVKMGRIVRAKVTQVRNPVFHRKVWALFKLAFDIWSETVPRQEYKGQAIEPSLDRFRKDLTVLAGYYTPVWNLKGELRLEPASISFANMDQETFEKLFSSLINVVLSRVLTNTNMDEASLRHAVDEVLHFDQG